MRVVFWPDQVASRSRNLIEGDPFIWPVDYRHPGCLCPTAHCPAGDFLILCLANGRSRSVFRKSFAPARPRCPIAGADRSQGRGELAVKDLAGAAVSFLARPRIACRWRTALKSPLVWLDRGRCMFTLSHYRKKNHLVGRRLRSSDALSENRRDLADLRAQVGIFFFFFSLWPRRGGGGGAPLLNLMKRIPHPPTTGAASCWRGWDQRRRRDQPPCSRQALSL